VLQRPLSDGSLEVGLRGLKQDGDTGLVSRAGGSCRCLHLLLPLGGERSAAPADWKTPRSIARIAIGTDDKRYEH
jgi:hypothetical protein